MHCYTLLHNAFKHGHNRKTESSVMESSVLTSLVVGEVQDLHAIWVGNVCGLGFSIVIDLSIKNRN